MNHDIDVAIVGYGPTGQMLALLLGRMGHSVAIVDRWPDLYPLPRAVHFDHEIARLFQAAGIAEDVMAITEPVKFYEWRNAKREILLQLDWGGPGPSGWPVSTMFSQPELERVLDRHVKALPAVTVLQGWSAESMTQGTDGVTIGVEHGDVADGRWKGDGQRRTLRAKYVVGADGANSFVRHAIGARMHDIGFAFDWLVVDVKPRTERVWEPPMWQLCDPARPTTIVPSGPGRRRWEFMALPGETAAEMNHAEVAWKLLAPWDITPANAELERHAIYTFRGQWADRWQQGRAFLAGDAAHLTPPFAGQGMCSGMRDSLALAWRLDAVLKGRLGPKALESYGPERSGHMQQLIGFAVELGKVICIPDQEAARQRDEQMIAARLDPTFKDMPPPQPRLGEGGIVKEGAPGAGFLGIQARAGLAGRHGRLDDLVGPLRFTVLARDAATLAAISEANRRALQSQGAVLLHLREGGLEDLEGKYGAWLDELGSVAVLWRPDFYLQGGARDEGSLNELLDHWRAQLAIPA